MSCKSCISIMKWFPVLMILSIIAWSYYAYVIELCFGTATIRKPLERVLYLIFYHAFFVMFIWSYWQTIFNRSAKIPESYHVSQQVYDDILRIENVEQRRRMLNDLAANLPILTFTAKGDIRYCERCRAVKPDRAHHCGVCGRCNLKMDHHCPWVNNCITFFNYKFFLLFLLYALLYCFYVCATVLPYFILSWEGGVEGNSRIHILFLFFVSIMLAISLISLFLYHCYLVSVNRTTIEAFRSPVFRNGPDKHGYNLGLKKNLEQVFGTDRRTWLIPLSTSLGDGINFPTNNTQQQVSKAYNSMGTTNSNPTHPLLNNQIAKSTQTVAVRIDSINQIHPTNLSDVVA